MSLSDKVIKDILRNYSPLILNYPDYNLGILSINLKRIRVLSKKDDVFIIFQDVDFKK